MNPKRVAVIAYSARNLGDDLFTTLLVDRYPDVQFYFFAPSRESLGAVADRGNVTNITDRGFFGARFDLLLVLGGSMFQETRSWTRSWLRHMLRFAWSWIRRCPTAIVGISFGPVRTPQFLTAHRVLFRMASWVSVRDTASLGMLNGLPRVHQFPDLAFAHPLTTPSLQGSHEPHVGMSIMDFGPEVSHPAYLSGCADLLESITATVPVTLFAFQEYGGIDDAAAIREVIGMLTPRSKDRVTVVHYDGSNLPQFLDSFRSCSLIVASRLHSLIIASAMDIPCVAISYHPKVSDTINSLHLSVRQVSPDRLAEAASDIGEAIVQAIGRDIEGSVSPHRASAIQHLTYLDSRLSGPTA